jgi:N-acyl-D-amino-acid deacylase
MGDRMEFWVGEEDGGGSVFPRLPALVLALTLTLTLALGLVLTPAPAVGEEPVRGAGPFLAMETLAAMDTLPVPPNPGASQEVDVILRNGRLLDGSGNPWVRGDVAIRGDRVVAVGRLRGWTAPEDLDVSGLFVAPGFIDAHSHAGPGLASEDRSHAFPQLAQGITTVFVNPDGGGPVNLVEQRGELLQHGLGINVAQLVPHGSVRGEVLGMEDRRASPAELEEMRARVRAGMEAGAFGLSSGPFYAPGSFSDTRELVELARVAAEYGGVYTSHIRDESDYGIGLIAAVDEVITVAREAEIRGVVTHVKALGPRVWGFSTAVVRRIERAREEGVEVFADQYPYIASATGLSSALVPRWAQEGGAESMRARLRDPETRPRLVEEIWENLDRRGGADRIQFRSFTEDPSIEGRTLAEVAEERGLDAVGATLELLGQGSPSIVSFNMDERDVAEFMRQPWTMTASDGDFPRWGEGVPHPRSYGAFSRKLRHYVVEEGVVTLEEAIRSMTSLPALVHRMENRGRLRAGMVADVVVFDLERVRDRATFTDPHQLSEGMVHVLVNGGFAIRDGGFTDLRNGRVLRMGEGP